MEEVSCPFSIKLIVAESRLKNATHDSVIESDKHQASTIPGLTYFVEIELRDDRENNKNRTQIGLEVRFKDIKSVSTEFKWTIKSAGYEWCSSTLYNQEGGYGPHICSYDDLMNPEKKWIVDGNLTVEISGVFFADVPVAQVPIKSTNLLLSSLCDRTDKDFTFVVDKKEIKVHKLVLANASAVFDQMLVTDWKESTEGKYTIEDFDSETVDDAIHFIYDKPIDVTVSNAIPLMQFGDKYDIAELKNKMEDYLIGEIINVNVVQLSNASILSDAQKLREKCFDFLLANLRKTHIADIDELDADFKDELMKEVFNCVSVVGP